jgi:hypothetical protein
VKLTLHNAEFTDWKPYDESEDPFPIKELAPGASFYIPVRVGMYGSGSPYALAELTWRDRRLRRQHWTSTVSTAGMILGGASLENFHAAKESKRRDTLRVYGL